MVLDQLTKHWALNTLTDRNIDLVGSLRFNLAFNTGMAFSQGTGLGPIIGIVALFVVVGLLVSIGRADSPRVSVGRRPDHRWGGRQPGRPPVPPPGMVPRRA